MISKRSNITIIGAGKIAYSLVHALTKNGYKINLIISNNLISAKKLSGKFFINNYSDNLAVLDSKSKIIFLAIPDNQIEITAKKIVRLKTNIRGSLIIHLSGAETISKLSSLMKKGALTGSFHIMQTFPSRRIVKIENCYSAIETDNKYVRKFLFKLSKDLKLKPFKLNSNDKTLYHLAGVFASNFLVGNIFNAENIFNIKKNNNYNNFDFLSPIIKSTLDNINKLGSSKALSGPIERGDLSTIKKHIHTLKRINKNNRNINSVVLNYMIQSFNLLNVVQSKYKKLNKKHLELQEYLIRELKAAISDK